MKRINDGADGAVMMTGLLVSGCKKDNGPDEAAPVGVTNEEQAMQYFAKNDEFVANDEETFADTVGRDVRLWHVRKGRCRHHAAPLGTVRHERDADGDHDDPAG